MTLTLAQPIEAGNKAHGGHSSAAEGSTDAGGLKGGKGGTRVS